MMVGFSNRLAYSTMFVSRTSASTPQALSMRRRSSVGNIGRLAGCGPIATCSSSKSFLAWLMTQRWPLVGGSKLPEKIPIFIHR